jgi:hypothetical protein
LEAETLGALDAFTSAIRTADSQRQYLNRLGYFFDYLQLPGTTIEEQAASFLNKAREKSNGLIAASLGLLIIINKKLQIRNYHLPL